MLNSMCELALNVSCANAPAATNVIDLVISISLEFRVNVRFLSYRFHLDEQAFARSRYPEYLFALLLFLAVLPLRAALVIRDVTVIDISSASTHPHRNVVIDGQ